MSADPDFDDDDIPETDEEEADIDQWTLIELDGSADLVPLRSAWSHGDDRFG